MGVPQIIQKYVHFSIETHGFGDLPFEETPISSMSDAVKPPEGPSSTCCGRRRPGAPGGQIASAHVPSIGCKGQRRNTPHFRDDCP